MIKIQKGIPDSVIKEVLQRNDIVETVGKYVHLVKQGKYMKGLCPFHSEKTPSFTVTPEKQLFYCYGCGQGGDVIKFVSELEGYSFPEAVRTLALEAGIPVDWEASEHQSDTPYQRDRSSLLAAHELTAKLYHHLLNNTEFGIEAKDYLRSRGLTDKLIDHFMIGYAPERWDTLTNFLSRREYDLELMERGGLLLPKNDGSGHVDRFRGRIMFPLWDREGKVIGFAGRLMGEGQPKYLNSPETILFNKSKSLYHFHHARQEIKKSGKLVLFEGYMDVIKAWDAGVRNGVATMGTSLTEEHVEIIRRAAQEVVVCYDGDKAGQAAALKTIPMLEKAGLKTSVAVLPQGLDPDDYIKDKGPEAFIREVMSQPVSPLKFRLIYSRKSHTMVEEEGRKNYVIEAVRLIAQHDSAIEREFYLKELSLEFDISLDTLKQNCHQVREQMQKNKSNGDNNAFSWNNGMNEKRRSAGPPPVLPAYQKAERHLLQIMLQDADIAGMVYDRLGDAFVVEDHAALAAYLYAYYAQGNGPDVSRFIATLQDDRLERAAASILMMEDTPFDDQLLHDYVKVIRKEQKLRLLEQRREEWTRAERSGNHLLAAQIVTEIIALEIQLNEGLEERF
ncbi:DNA primase [Paenibacillus sp. GCM10012307]|uniref:DNA primase n=1 Tax=Paenibacillus sp. GCM10012307 TaxID=3317343 RepID=UPI002FCDEA92